MDLTNTPAAVIQPGAAVDVSKPLLTLLLDEMIAATEAGDRRPTRTITSLYVLTDADNAQLIRATDTLTLSSSPTGVSEGVFSFVWAEGGDVTFDPEGALLVNGAVSQVIPSGSWGLIISRGTAGFVLLAPSNQTLGTAAALDHGTDSGNLVRLGTGGRLPAVDAQNLQNLPLAMRRRGSFLIDNTTGEYSFALPSGIEAFRISIGALTPVVVKMRMGISSGLVQSGYASKVNTIDGVAAGSLSSTTEILTFSNTITLSVDFQRIEPQSHFWTFHGVENRGQNAGSFLSGSVALNEEATQISIYRDTGLFQTGAMAILY